jgi:hypothetical protein
MALPALKPYAAIDLFDGGVISKGNFPQHSAKASRIAVCGFAVVSHDECIRDDRREPRHNPGY